MPGLDINVLKIFSSLIKVNRNYARFLIALKSPEKVGIALSHQGDSMELIKICFGALQIPF